MKKIDRKDFLKIGGGTIAGGLTGYVFSGAPFSGLQWLAEWTQDQHVPIRGEEKYLTSFCEACPAKCNISLRKISSRAVKIETSNSGCPLGQNLLQLLYHPERITKPLKLSGKKGSGKYQEVSWEKAINDITGKLNNSKAGSIAAINKEINLSSDLLNLLVNSLESNNSFYEDSLTSLNNAVFDGQVEYDFSNSDFILSFGSKLLEGWGNPGTMNSVLDKWIENKTKIIQIDSTNTRTTSMATEWIPVKAGTEAILALGIAHYLIREKNLTVNVKDSAKWSTIVINHYPLKTVEKLTGVSEEKIKELAESLAKAKNPIAVGGKGAKGVSSSSSELIAVYALNLMTQTSAVKLKKHVGLSTSDTKNMGIDKFIKDSNFEILFLNSSDPVYKSVYGEELKEKMKKAFVVSISPLKNNSDIFADYILPPLTFLESKNAKGEQLVASAEETIHAGDMIIEIAKKVNKAKNNFPWKSYLDVLPLAGKTVETNNEIDLHPDTLKNYLKEYKKIHEDKEFSLNLVPIEAQVIGDGDGMAFPYVLKSIGPETFSNGKMWVQMNNETAEKEGIYDGECIKIISKQGKIGSVRVHRTDTIAPGIVAIPLGFGHETYTKYGEDKGYNPKTIMTNDIDPLTGTANWWLTRVKIS